MKSISNLLSCLAPSLQSTSFRQLGIIIPALLAMTGRVTMLGISRWTDKGGSYRTVQRFFSSSIAWLNVHWLFIQSQFSDSDAEWIAAGDETVVTKAGKSTFGLGRFYSSLYGKPVPGLIFFAISLINVSTRTSYPIYIKQQPSSKKETSSNTPKSKSEITNPTKKKRGRPKGSKNKNKTEVELSPHLIFVKTMISNVLRLIKGTIKLRYFVLDGAYGFNAAVQMVKQAGLEIISKLRINTELYFPYDGPYAGRGPRRKYGKRVDYNKIPNQYLKETTTEDGILTKSYQMTVWHKLFPQMLNVVVIHKTNLKTEATAHVILFSSDLDLGYDKIIDYYKLRFQIEFNFREAKQYWGLEDFMNVKETSVTNAVNLAFLMVNLSKAWITDNKSDNPNFSVEDLKAHFRGQKYVREIIKLLPEKPDRILFSKIKVKIEAIGSINT